MSVEVINLRENGNSYFKLMLLAPAGIYLYSPSV